MPWQWQWCWWLPQQQQQQQRDGTARQKIHVFWKRYVDTFLETNLFHCQTSSSKAIDYIGSMNFGLVESWSNFDLIWMILKVVLSRPRSHSLVFLAVTNWASGPGLSPISCRMFFLSSGIKWKLKTCPSTRIVWCQHSQTQEKTLAKLPGVITNLLRSTGNTYVYMLFIFMDRAPTPWLESRWMLGLCIFLQLYLSVLRP